MRGLSSHSATVVPLLHRTQCSSSVGPLVYMRSGGGGSDCACSDACIRSVWVVVSVLLLVPHLSGRLHGRYLAEGQALAGLPLHCRWHCHQVDGGTCLSWARCRDCAFWRFDVIMAIWCRLAACVLSASGGTSSTLYHGAAMQLYDCKGGLDVDDVLHRFTTGLSTGFLLRGILMWWNLHCHLDITALGVRTISFVPIMTKESGPWGTVELAAGHLPNSDYLINDASYNY